MTLSFRPATLNDAASLDAIFRASFTDTFGHLYRPEDLSEFLLALDLGKWRSQLGNEAYAFRIGEADGTPAGFVKLGPMKLPIATEGSAILLDQLYVLKEHHGAGIARPLMDWAIVEAVRRGTREMYLTVFVDNHRARRFYERYGFEAVGRYDFMVGAHADEDIIMRKAL